jgi:CBS domain-containing protein
MSATPEAIDAGALVAGVLQSHFGATQRHRAYPVTQDGAVIGMLDRAGLEAAGRTAVHVRELYGVNAPIVALRGETCRTVAIRLAVHGLERIPVVADAAGRQLVGVVSRSDLIKSTLILHDEENTRHRFRRLSLRNARTD